MTYAKALMINESKDGLDIESMPLEDLLSVIDDMPSWDCVLAGELLHELARRAEIREEEFFKEDSCRDCNDLWYAAAEKLGYNEDGTVKQYRVLPEYRDSWGNDPDWDFIVSMKDIKWFANQLGVEDALETLMSEVEEV